MGGSSCCCAAEGVQKPRDRVDRIFHFGGIHRQVICEKILQSYPRNDAKLPEKEIPFITPAAEKEEANLVLTQNPDSNSDDSVLIATKSESDVTT